MKDWTLTFDPQSNDIVLVKKDGELLFVFQISDYKVNDGPYKGDRWLAVQVLHYPDGDESEQFVFDTLYSADGRKTRRDRM